jgi:hypothetical protein
VQFASVRGQNALPNGAQELRTLEMDFLLSLSDLGGGGYYSMSEQFDRPTAFARLHRAPFGNGVCRTRAAAR